MLLPMPGAVFTSLAPPGGGPAIHVYVYPGHGPPSDNVLPFVRCHAVRIGGLRGRRCTALISASPVTILTAGRRTYRISSDAGIDRAVYDRVANGLRLIRPQRVCCLEPRELSGASQQRVLARLRCLR